VSNPLPMLFETPEDSSHPLGDRLRPRREGTHKMLPTLEESRIWDTGSKTWGSNFGQTKRTGISKKFSVFRAHSWYCRNDGSLICFQVSWLVGSGNWSYVSSPPVKLAKVEVDNTGVHIDMNLPSVISLSQECVGVGSIRSGKLSSSSLISWWCWILK